jgi:hypothetical protein
MATIIKIKTSSGIGTPATAKVGELSYSYAAGTYNTLGDRLFIGVGPVGGDGNASQQVAIGGKYFTGLLGATPGTLAASGAILVDANKAIDQLIVGNSSGSSGFIKLNEATNNGTDSVTIKAPTTLAGSVTLTLPGTAGSSGQVLTTDGLGTLSFTTPSITFTISGDTGSSSYLTSNTLDFQGNTQIVTDVTGSQVSFSIGAGSIGTTQLTNAGVTNAKLQYSKTTLGSTDLTLGSTVTTLAGLTQLDVNNVRISGNTISSTNTDGDINLSPNGQGTVKVPSGYKDRTSFSALSLATKDYVDQVSQGLNIKQSVKAATTAALGAYTYNNGTSGVNATLTKNSPYATFQIDTGVSLTVGDRILIKNEPVAGAFDAYNGIYTITSMGSSSAPWVLTRATDADTPQELTSGSFVFVSEGDTNSKNGYVITYTGTLSLGYTELTVTQFSGAGSVVAGAALTKNGNTLDVAVDDSSIEINADALRIKALGVTNAMLAGSIVNSKLSTPYFTVADEAGTPSTSQINLNSTLTFMGGTALDSVVTTNTVTFNAKTATSSALGVAYFPTDNFTVTTGSVAITTIDGGTY